MLAGQPTFLPTGLFVLYVNELQTMIPLRCLVWLLTGLQGPCGRCWSGPSMVDTNVVHWWLFGFISTKAKT